MRFLFQTVSKETMEGCDSDSDKKNQGGMKSNDVVVAFSDFNEQTTFTPLQELGAHSCVITKGQPHGGVHTRCSDGTCTLTFFGGRAGSKEVANALYHGPLRSWDGATCDEPHGNYPVTLNFAFCGNFHTDYESFPVCFGQGSITYPISNNRWVLASPQKKGSCTWHGSNWFHHGDGYHVKLE